MDFHIIQCPLQHSKRIMLGTFRTIKCHFGGFLNPTPHFIPHLFYLRLMFLGSVRSPLHLKHLKPFGTLATIKPHLAPSLLILTPTFKTGENTGGHFTPRYGRVTEENVLLFTLQPQLRLFPSYL